MQNNQSDRFEPTKASPFERDTNSASNNKEDNFFITQADNKPIRYFSQEQSRRLNDYDLNLLKEDAYKEVDNDLFKLEYKISKIESELSLLNGQIQAARDINDYNLIQELNLRKNSLTEEFETLIALYNNKSISARFSDGISNIFTDKLKNKFNLFKSNLNSLTEVLLSKLPKRFTSVLELKRSLSKLENINRSVDELITFNSPYGENIDKYEQLSKYIIRANAIQSQISRFIK